MAGFPQTSQLIGSDIGWNGPDATASQQAFYTLANQLLQLQNQLTAANAKITALQKLGTYVEANAAFGSVTGWVTNTPKNVVTLVLNPGTWMVAGEGIFGGGAITGTDSLYQISQTSANFDTVGGLDPGLYEVSSAPTAAANIQLACAPRRFVVPTNTTLSLFLVGRIVFSAGTPTAGGALRAWQVAP